MKRFVSKKIPRLLMSLALSLMILAGLVLPARASDHQDTLFLGFQLPAADLTDLYVFESPTNSNNAVFVMDFDPFIPAGQTRPFDPAILYQFKIDTTGDRVEDVVMQFTFSGTAPNQTVTMYGPGQPNQPGTTSTTIATLGSGAVNQNLSLPGGVQLFAGTRKDPFFLDLARLFEIIPDRNYLLQPNPAPPFQVTSWRDPGEAVDAFLNANINSIIVELPRDLIGSGPISTHVSTSLSALPPLES
ncbi:MAG: DUF4331 family protein [Cyanophyceae cyanobacterium]|jgi:hypothetical protein